jgi:hypothetical protein
MFTDLEVAEACHDALRGLQKLLSLPRSVVWRQLPDWKQKLAAELVREARMGKNGEDLHRIMCDAYAANQCEHSMAVPWEQLTSEQRMLNKYFISLVVLLSVETPTRAEIFSGARCTACGARASQPAFLEHQLVGGRPCPSARKLVSAR